MSDTNNTSRPPGEEVEVTAGLPPSTSAPGQHWTPDGYPIVDGKYHDLATGEIKTHNGLRRGGPPSLSVYWHSRGTSTSQADSLFAVGAFNALPVTEYLVRMGEMLREGTCTVGSLNVTEYAVNVIVETELPRTEFMEKLRNYGLLSGPSTEK
ncbi:hypothetical protein F5X68DRAFT_212399 [Plectosphaerella plurivora]|uniref:Uncharacterized protein n=1 Tax=Plectosphaerella plurivora TaxID=936078 RepID=A0A9P8V7S1_9PEZI|nr:hypothetical protein F5X68DRAFT_212399 [Plectosphaerella plurivora]